MPGNDLVYELTEIDTDFPHVDSASKTRPVRQVGCSDGYSTTALLAYPTTQCGPGYHPFHAPCGIMLNEKNMPFSTCVRCMDCDGFPCVVHAKADAEVLAVRPALQYPTSHC